MSLRWRLIISYAVIILVTLVLAFATLIIIARPIQSRLLGTRLAGQSQFAARQINNLYRQGASTQRIVEQLDNRFARLNNQHLVFLDMQGRVLVDSQNIWTDQSLALPDSNSGTFEAPDGQAFMYALSPVGPEDSPAGYVAAVSASGPVTGRLVAELGSGFVVAGLVSLLVSLLLGVLIARSIGLPLQQIARATGAVAAGDYEHRVPEKGPPEIKRVAASFNGMAAQVQAGQQAMRDFVSNVSHELKTPLTSIQGFSQAIMEGATHDESARRRAAGIIYKEAARMSRLVEDLLDLARLDSGQVVMSKTPLDLVQILENTVDRLLPQATKKGVQLRTGLAQTPQIVGDGDRLAQVFTNFLDNAIKHTPSGGQVLVSSQILKGVPRPRRVRPGLIRPDATTTVSERSDFVEITISDTGPGLAPADLARIFERFYQVDKSRKRGQGTGLGLAIAKEIVEAHGGYLRAESEPELGTKFMVLLPITEADARTLISPSAQ